MHGATPRLISLSPDIAIGPNPPPLRRMCALNKYDVFIPNRAPSGHWPNFIFYYGSIMDLGFKG